LTTACSRNLMRQISGGCNFEVTAAEDGTLELMVGADFGFEKKKTIYYNPISVVLEHE